jgi:hypothetical protein
MHNAQLYVIMAFGHLLNNEYRTVWMKNLLNEESEHYMDETH